MPARGTTGGPSKEATYDKLPTLVLQGGGALGSYQAGVYQALAESEYAVDWVAGTSIGGINAAPIAGNAPEHRLGRLDAFRETITEPSAHWPDWQDALFGDSQREAGALSALLFGQPGFFEHWRPASGYFSGCAPSWYDTGPLRLTLERDARATLAQAPWHAPSRPEIGVRVFDVAGRGRAAGRERPA